MELPKYVLNDLQVLDNAEFKIDKFGYTYTDNCKLAEKLFKMAKKYPQKYLHAVLDYLGYFDGSVELDESDYRAEILHNAEYYFIQAMNDVIEMYDGKNINKQVFFIEQGLIDGWFSSAKRWKEKGYEPKYPSKAVYL